MMFSQIRFSTLAIIFVTSLSSLLASTDKWDGEQYTHNSASQRTAAIGLLNKIPLQGNERTLDLGCGDGKVTAALAAVMTRGNVVGVDTSPSMIEHAQASFPKDEHPNLEFELQDASQLAFQEDFDLIVSFTALQWMTDQLEVLKGVQRSLAPEGKMVASMPMGLPLALEKAIQETMMKEAWQGYFADFEPGWRFYDISEYQHLLMQADLQLVAIEKIEKNDVFPSRESFTGFIEQWLPHLQPLPEQLRTQFLDEVVNHFLELSPPDTTGKVYFDTDMMQIEAAKGA